MGNKKNSAIKGFAWSLAEKLLIQVVTFIVGIILARKLGPQTYGIVAMVSVIITIITVVTNLYTGTFLMRKKEIDSVDLNTHFYFCLIVNTICYLVLFFIAPLIADFYAIPEITNLLRVMGVIFISSSFSGVKLILVVRNYEYKKLFFASLFGTIVAGVVGVAFAYSGFGPWALVAQHCLDEVIDTIILWIVIKWKPKWEFSFKKLKEMTKFGLPLWLFGILDSFSTRIQTLVIGKQYTSEDLAYYNKGESFPVMIETNATSSLNNVLLRRVSEEQDNARRVRELLNKITKICLYISLPAMIGLAAVSDNVISILLGKEWLYSVPFMQIFCIALAFKPLETTSDVSLKAVGKSKLFFTFGIIKKSLFLISVVACVPFGVEAIAIGFAVASFLAALISVLANAIVFKLSVIKQLSNLLIPLTISIPMFAMVYRIGEQSSIPVYVTLIIQILAGVMVYLFGLLVVDPNGFMQTKKLFKHLKKEKPKK